MKYRMAKNKRSKNKRSVFGEISVGIEAMREHREGRVKRPTDRGQSNRCR